MLRHCTSARYAVNKERMTRLAEYSRDCLRPLRAETGIEYEGRQLGTLQVFRTAALALFDPQLIVLGPSAFVILDNFGATGYQFFAVLYPIAVGALCAGAGYLFFRRGDLP